MARVNRVRAVAASIALALMMVAGQAMAMKVVHGSTIKPLAWPQVFAIRALPGLNATTILIGGRTIGTYGRAGWGDYRLR